MKPSEKKQLIQITKELRDLARTFQKDRAISRHLLKMSRHALLGDLEIVRKLDKKLPLYVQTALLDLCPIAYDWIRFGVLGDYERRPSWTKEDVALGKKLLKVHGKRHKAAYTAALQRMVRGKQEYSGAAAWLRAEGYAK